MHACTRRESDKPQYSVYVSGPPCLGRIEQRCSFINTGYQANSSPPPSTFLTQDAGRRIYYTANEALDVSTLYYGGIACRLFGSCRFSVWFALGW